MNKVGPRCIHSSAKTRFEAYSVLRGNILENGLGIRKFEQTRTQIHDDSVHMAPIKYDLCKPPRNFVRY